MTILVLPLILSLSAAQEFTTMPGPVARRQTSFGIYTLEAAGGVTLGAVGIGCGITAALGYAGIDEGRAQGGMAVLLSVSPVLAVAGCAGGTCLVGSAFGQEGRFLPTLAYTAGTGALAYGLLLGGQSALNGPWGYHGVIGWSMISLGVAGTAAMSLAAVFGYNRSRPRSSYGSRFVPGSITLASVRDADGLIHPSLNVRLLSVRF